MKKMLHSYVKTYTLMDVLGKAEQKPRLGLIICLLNGLNQQKSQQSQPQLRQSL
jgi:hypothetical protein